MKIHKSVTVDRVIEAIEEDSCVGFCVNCGAERYYTEPDAREYECEECEQPKVYGAEELLMMIS